MKAVYVADFNSLEYKGGAEFVDETIYKHYLSIPFTKSKYLSNVDPNTTYILSNTLQLIPTVKDALLKHKNYVIFEHDYKIHYTRQPNLFKDNLFPKHEIINLDMYENARAVFMQSKDHLDCHVANGVKGNLINLSTSIWSDKELDELNTLGLTYAIENFEFAILDNPHPAKGTQNAINFCNNYKLAYKLIPKLERDKFLSTLIKYPCLVYIPHVKESFCRVIIEAHALYLNVITQPTYGATLEPWYGIKGSQLIEFLKKSSIDNINKIKEYL